MTQLLDMGAHGSYIWPAYAVFVIVLLIAALQPLTRQRRIRRWISNRARHNGGKS